MLVSVANGQWIAVGIHYLVYYSSGALIEETTRSVKLLRISLIMMRRSLELRIMVLVYLPGVLQSYRPAAVSPLRC